jgi:hypothetical protein
MNLEVSLPKLPVWWIEVARLCWSFRVLKFLIASTVFSSSNFYVFAMITVVDSLETSNEDAILISDFGHYDSCQHFFWGLAVRIVFVERNSIKANNMSAI